MTIEPLASTADPPAEVLDLTVMVENAVREIFATMIMLPVEVGIPLSEKIGELQHSVSAVVGFSGRMRGALVIHAPDPIACSLAGALLFSDIDQVDAEVKDCLGEIGNMVAGGIKTGLLDEGMEVELSIPSIIAGAAYRVDLLSRAEWLALPFSTEAGEFLVELKFALA